MHEEKEMEMPIVLIDTTVGLTSALQLIDTTSGEIFIAVRNDTTETEIQRIIYPHAPSIE